MLLAIDIGNTNITCGVIRGKRIVKKFDIPTGDYHLGRLKQNVGRLAIDDAIVCSVVPAISRIIERDLKLLLSKIPYFLGKDIYAPIKNLYRIPKQVGQDRLVNAYAGVVIYGSPLIVVDFGTAITFDIVSKDNEYIGGMILPGLGISLDVLSERTALLPRIKLEKPREFIGRDTKNSMLSGVIYGFAALTDEMAGRVKKKIGAKARVIGTGGNIQLIKRYCKRLDEIDKDLTLKGLRLIYRYYQKK